MPDASLLGHGLFRRMGELSQDDLIDLADTLRIDITQMDPARGDGHKWLRQRILDELAAGDALVPASQNMETAIGAMQREAALHGWQPDENTLRLWRDTFEALFDDDRLVFVVPIDGAAPRLRETADRLESVTP